ncbi:MAG TPA: hypothetical protein PLF48_10945 [Chitinophagales bacterium]|nr:hypothetical protein [Chitinophagales bacterium]
MNNKFILNNIFRFVILFVLQVFLFNQLPFGRIYIMIYPLAVLLLPVFTNRSIVLLSAFTLGIMIDLFSDGGGLHTVSILLIAYLRSYVLDTFQPKSGWDKLDVPTLNKQGITWYFYYTLILFSIHHLCFFYLEAFGFTNFFHTLFKTILSLFASLFIVWLISLFFMRNTKE